MEIPSIWAFLDTLDQKSAEVDAVKEMEEAQKIPADHDQVRF
jgi:hypothetical protein